MQVLKYELINSKVSDFLLKIKSKAIDFKSKLNG